VVEYSFFLILILTIIYKKNLLQTRTCYKIPSYKTRIIILFLVLLCGRKIVKFKFCNFPFRYSCLQKNGNCQNKIDTFLQFCHSVKPYERFELWSKFNDISSVHKKSDISQKSSFFQENDF
jgi:hypothetical protein